MAQRGSRHNKFNVLPSQSGTVYKAVSAFPGPPPNLLQRADMSSTTNYFSSSKQFPAPAMPAMPDWSSLPSMSGHFEKEISHPAFFDFDNSFLQNAKLPTHEFERYHDAFVSNLESAETIRAIVNACKELNIRDVAFDEEMGSAHGTFFAADHASIDFSFSLYSTDYDGASRVVAQIINGSGCRVAFSCFKSEMIKILKKSNVVHYTEICDAVWDPRHCPAVPPIASDTVEDELERLRARVGACLSECESGYARTITEDAPQLARFSEKEQSRILLKEIPDILERLIKLVEPSFESVLVRSVLVCLMNLCDGDEAMVRSCREKYQMSEKLRTLKDRWSRLQYPFGENFPHSVVESSREIMFQADLAISKLS